MKAHRIAFVLGLALVGLMCWTVAVAARESEPEWPLVRVGLDSGNSRSAAYKSGSDQQADSGRQSRIDGTQHVEQKEVESAKEESSNSVKSFISGTIQDLKDPEKREGTLANIWHWDTAKKQKHNSNFYDKSEGNKYSHSNRIFEWNSKSTPLEKYFSQDSTAQVNGDGAFNVIKIIQDVFKFETSLDYFGGLQLGDNPWNSPEVYRANVQNFKTSLSFNLTSSSKIQIANFARFGIEFEFVPLLLELQSDIYSSSTLNDNCFMMSG